ncbi:defensin-like protein 1 [Durio zibethinus]|uniref:Defensin-like protein 1 n=1 Tax=Durio zibethinus TaxID=66656 RepID=A0A6P5WMU9_DURZI|nr:defensin-like protein 1 [Durio zibethinus]XP_022717108.1 defensin-like protein 1 [Durio zibethinus]
MEMKKLFGMLLLLLFIVSASEPSEARVCESKSHRFKGPCLSHHNCGMVCKNEGFSGGKCRGVRRRCFCTRRC